MTVQANRIYSASFLSRMTVGDTNSQQSINVDNLLPQMYTVQFSILDYPIDAFGVGSSIPSIQADISWNVQGQQQQRTVSVIPGTTISNVAQGVNVKIRDVNNTLPSSIQPGARYKVQASLCAGSRASSSQPPTLSTDRQSILSDGDAVVLDVPQNSGVISVYPFIGFTFPGFVGIADIIGTLELRYKTPGTVLQCQNIPLQGTVGWVPLVPGCDEVRIRYDSGSGGLRGAFVGALWGVDG